MSSSDFRRRQYEHWVRAFAPDLYRFAYRLSGKHEVAEDLVQETFVEAWRSLDSQRQPDRARAWLFQILRFRYAHLVRDAKARVQPTGSPEALQDHAADAGLHPLEMLANQEALQLAFDTLPQAMKETFLMVFLEGRTCRETGEILHIPLGTVLSRLDRARQLLRTALAAFREPKRSSASAAPSAGSASAPRPAPAPPAVNDLVIGDALPNG